MDVREIIKTGTAEEIYEYARDNAEILLKKEIEDLQKAVEELDMKGDIIYMFARDVEGADIESLQKSLEKAIISDLRKEKIELLFLFFKNVENANARSLQDVIMRLDPYGNLTLRFAELYRYLTETRKADASMLGQVYEIPEENKLDSEKIFNEFYEGYQNGKITEEMITSFLRVFPEHIPEYNERKYGHYGSIGIDR